MPWEFDFLTEVAFIHKDLKTRRLKNNLLHMEVMRIRVIRFLFTSQDTRHIGGTLGTGLPGFRHDSYPSLWRARS